VFPEYAVDGANGASIGNDGFSAGTLTGRAWWKTLTVQWLYAARKKHIPTGVSETIFPSNGTNYLDRRGFVELRLEPKVGDVQWLTRAHANLYLYDDRLDYPFDTTTPVTTGGPYFDSYRGEWFGLEQRLMAPLHKTLQLTVGGEAQYHPLTRQRSRTAAGEELLARNDPFTVGAAYLVADWTPAPALKVSPAMRLDYYSTVGTSLNPRLAILVHPSSRTTTKLLAGKAFRAPGIFELFYQSDTFRTPDSLKPEDIYSGELEVSQRLTPTLTATVSGYASYVRNLIQLSGGGTAADPNFYINSDQSILSTGVEGELRRELRRFMFAAQVSLQRTRYLDVAQSGGREVPNSPAVLGSLKAAVPIALRTLMLTSRLSYVGPRWDRYDRPGDPEQQKVGGAAVWDLVFSGEADRVSLHYSIGVYNVLDTRWSVPVSGEYRMRTIPQNGRTLYASLSVTL
jgi:outer membrane receptor for ferrienterochelin and colicins